MPLCSKCLVSGLRQYLVTQAFYGVSLFEIINYIEHYGLKREQKADGSYARTMPEHSWNNNNIVTNLFLYQLQRHSISSCLSNSTISGTTTF